MPVSPDGVIVIENTSTDNGTFIHIKKVWKENGQVMSTPPEDCGQIQVTLWRVGKGDEAKAIDAATRAPVEGDAQPTPFTLTVDQTAVRGNAVIVSDPANSYNWVITDLERYDQDGEEYEYYIKELAPSGWSVVSYSNGTMTDDTPGEVVEYDTAKEARVKGGGTITVTNGRHRVSLPATGGSGTAFFRAVGSLQTLLAAAMLLKDRRAHERRRRD